MCRDGVNVTSSLAERRPRNPRAKIKVMPFPVTANVHVERDPNGTVRQLRHFQHPYLARTLSGRSLAAQYVQEVAETYQLPPSALTRLNSPFYPTNNFTSEPTRLRFASENALLGTSTLAFVQTLGDLPIVEAGLSVTVQAGPDRVTSSFSTFHHDAKVDAPEREFQPYSASELERLLGLGSREWLQTYHEAGEEIVRAHDMSFEPLFFAPSSSFRRTALRAHTLYRRLGLFLTDKLEITSQRRLIYRHEAARRIDPEAIGAPTLLRGTNPMLALPPVPDTLPDGSHYVVVEVLFKTDPGPAALNWRAFIEERTGSVLYLRALFACALGNVFRIDPVSDTGNDALTGCSGHAMLDPIQTTVTLPVIPVSPQSLTSEFVSLSNFKSPSALPPTSPPASFTTFASDSIDFGAVNAFYHMDRFFRLMSDLGIDPTTYFSATKLPLPVDHLDTTVTHRREGVPTGPGPVGGYVYGNPGGKGCQNIGLSYTAMSCTNPVLAGCDQRVVFHECSHLMLWEKTHWGRLRFCHSTGDSLAIIFADPQSNAPDRFLSFPFIPLANRRHDRDVAAGWAWGGQKDRGEDGYDSEQILATTQFRLYRSAGGDDDRKAVQIYASNYILYLIIRAIGLLPPADIAPTLTVDTWVTALMNADIGTSSFAGVPGGTVHKMIRWAFEKQGLYQPPDAPLPPNVATAGAPPDVDVYIDDGRGGEYSYLQSFWNNPSIWNRNCPDGGTTHDPPIVGVANYAYVQVKNRGTQSANNVVVSGYHASPASGLTWPGDWIPMTTASLPMGSIPSGGSAIVGPFVWTPQFLGHGCMLMIASADGDLPNTDPSAGLPCATGPTPHWRLVPFDNNLGQRNVTTVARRPNESGHPKQPSDAKASMGA